MHGPRAVSLGSWFPPNFFNGSFGSRFFWSREHRPPSTLPERQGLSRRIGASQPRKSAAHAPAPSRNRIAAPIGSGRGTGCIGAMWLCYRVQPSTRGRNPGPWPSLPGRFPSPSMLQRHFPEWPDNQALNRMLHHRVAAVGAPEGGDQKQSADAGSRDSSRDSVRKINARPAAPGLLAARDCRRLPLGSAASYPLARGASCLRRSEP